jgi:protein-L-isoaspartate(D-aspartate) O-methyltransferase
MHVLSSTDPLLRRYAGIVMRAAGVDAPRVERVFASIPRAAFLPPPPWTIISQGVASETSDVTDIYDNVLVALDRRHGINNGEPALHAAWLAAVDPRPGESVIHVGTGAGYYTAMLASLVGPGGRVEGYEINEPLAREAARNLRTFANVAVNAGSALRRALAPADVVYVNAGVTAPDPAWLGALNPGGRLIFPWQPLSNWGNAMLVDRRPGGFSAVPIMGVGFIACSDEPSRGRAAPHPSEGDIARTRSVWLTRERAPDRTATAAYDDVWFSACPVEA